MLHVVHTDVKGPAKTTTMGGFMYYVTFIDDHTRTVWVYFMKEKSEVFSYFQRRTCHIVFGLRLFLQ